jgi:hypothetical protein
VGLSSFLRLRNDGCFSFRAASPTDPGSIGPSIAILYLALWPLKGRGQEEGDCGDGGGGGAPNWPFSPQEDDATLLLD